MNMNKNNTNSTELTFNKPLDQFTMKEIDEIADNCGKYIAGSIKTNQIRNIFKSILGIRTKMKNLQKTESIESLKRDLFLIKPKLAYAVGRNKNTPQYREFGKILVNAIDQVDKSKNNLKLGFENFVLFVEAVVAYHKFYGGKD